MYSYDTVSFSGNEKKLTSQSLSDKDFKTLVGQKIKQATPTTKMDVASELTEVLDLYLQGKWDDKVHPHKRKTVLAGLKKLMGVQGQGNIVMAQINPIPGNVEANAKKAMAYIRAAEAIGADSVVFPELTLMGYPIHDAREIKTKDGRTLKGMTVLRGLQADGMNFKKMMEINERLIKDGYSPSDCLSYGVGGFLHDAISRSNMSAAQKLAEVGKGTRKRPVMKCPIDGPAKESIPGEVKLVREEGSNEPTVRRLNENGKSAYVTWYDGIDGHGIEYREEFSKVQSRVLGEFDKYRKPDKIFSPGVEDLKTQIRSKHRN